MRVLSDRHYPTLPIAATWLTQRKQKNRAKLWQRFYRKYKIKAGFFGPLPDPGFWFMFCHGSVPCTHMSWPRKTGYVLGQKSGKILPEEWLGKIRGRNGNKRQADANKRSKWFISDDATATCVLRPCRDQARPGFPPTSHFPPPRTRASVHQKFAWNVKSNGSRAALQNKMELRH